jgi:ParB family transcriptional regulator, chromosome partitioning protein
MSRPADRVRRSRKSLQLLRKLRALKDRGYSAVQAVEQLDSCCKAYRFRIFYFLKHADRRLIEQVEQGRIPFTVAIRIADARTPEMQKMLADGYKAGTLKGPQINLIWQSIDDHEKENAASSLQSSFPKRSRRVAADVLIRHFRKETDRQKLVMRKAKLAQSRLAFITKALKQLFSEERFVALLATEGVHTMPNWLTERIKGSP